MPERRIHYTPGGWRETWYACHGTYWGHSGTADLADVTCRRCRASHEFQAASGVKFCDNEDHYPRPVRAVVALSWPDGPFKPCDVCAGCSKWSIRNSLDEGHAVTITPIKEPADA